MTAKEAIKQLQTEHDLIAGERDLDGSQFAPALLEALAMAIEVLKRSEIPNCSEPKCADGCIYGWGSSECGHCDYRSEEPKTGDTISRKAAIDVAIKADIENNDGVLSEKRARIIDKRISAMPPAQPERDIPVKPIETTDKAWGIPKRQAVCPKCDYYLGHVAFLDDYKGKRITYCEVCGQAIDWEGWEFDE